LRDASSPGIPATVSRFIPDEKEGRS